ncbi:universal stress protein [Gloeobacter kilaueensis]|uniref:UspA domain-containing protein n=1 Tax=Gloeobacter kilaueensis (strain ATCC BAA-2537 / CCAP 1431/1 / ULC 316 / JS1) TaxID=1183438 RepID=U5QMM6_GLOK1|nr:universal stress protein [Gloeobacter kilaueensis]AGY60257.1 UspA domain-containing protein [Gloeobacter kilaueensis JS1]
MQRILVAFDLSEAGRAVFAAALELARATKAHLQLLHVLSGDEEGSPALPLSLPGQFYPSLDDEPLRLYLESYRRFEQSGLDLLEAHKSEAEAAGLVAETTQVAGHPGRKICELAVSWQADLIVIGRRGRSTLSALFLGSVSNYVLHHAPCSVYVVYHRPK